MNKINFLYIKSKKIELKERNLIITGKNGSGKTLFLRQLEDNLKNNLNFKYQNLERENLLNDIKYGIDNFTRSLKLKNEEIKFYYDLKNKNFNEDQFKRNLFQLYSILLNKYDNFKIENHIYIINTNEDVKKSHRQETNPEKINEEYYYYNNPEHITDFINRITISINQYNEVSKLFKISPNNFNKDKIFVFDASRVKNNRFNRKIFRDYEFYKKDNQNNIEEALEAYLILNKSKLITIMEEQETTKKVNKKVEKLGNWFSKVENDLKFILENPDIRISFNHQIDQVLLVDRKKNSFFSFDSLSSGFKSIFHIYANLLMRAQLQNLAPENLAGIAIIDEIDVHLHISLQKKVLIFLIRAFPKIQFIVSTHSPFVITSMNNDTAIYDISSGEFFEEDLSRYSYESVIKGLFHVEVQSDQLTSEIKAIAEILNNEPDNYEKLRDILKNILPFSKKLDVESKSFYFKALNHLLDNQELGDLDV